MIEIPEAATLATQLNDNLRGKRIAGVVAGQSPHKWAWFHGDPGGYGDLLRGKVFGPAGSHGGFVDIEVGDARVQFAEGVSLRLHQPGTARPGKHQLLVEFDDASALSGSVQMYGGLWAFPEGAFDNPYYLGAIARPSPLDDGFDAPYFERMLAAPGVEKLSVKAVLATEQRIPGLGNGVLQDILFVARLHPQRKVTSLTEADRSGLFDAVKGTLARMTWEGGRDTERDLFGRPGGYRTTLSRNTVGQPCPRCGTRIEKAQYLGGSVYFCGGCQVR